MTTLPLAVQPDGPRYRNVPSAVSSAGFEAVELAKDAGLVLDGWQAQALEDALGEDAKGKWAALEVGIIVPRQNGKGSILEARELAGLFLFQEQLILHSAHEFKTAAEAFRRLLFLIQSNSDLEKRVLRVRASHGEEGIELKSGQRIRFVARSTGSGRGFTGDVIILDEAFYLGPEAVAALYPTMSARPNPQIWYTSSAPLQDPRSDVLRRFCRRGRQGSPRQVYVEYSAELNCALDDRKAWADANPALGIRIDPEFIEVERHALGDEFARERLGHWIDDQDGSRVIPRDVWESCKDDKSGPTGKLAFALDVAPDRAWAAFAVAGDSPRGGTHLELVDYRRGTDWLLDRAVEIQERWGGQLALAAGSPAASLLSDLRGAKVDVVEISGRQHAEACGAFYDAAHQRQVRHLGQPALNIAVDGAERKYSGDAWLWARRASTTDICPLVAVTLAKWLHTQATVQTAAPWAVFH